MSIIIKEKNRSSTPPPEGFWQVVLARVKDLGRQETAFGQKEQVRLIMELNERDKEGWRYTVSKRYSNSLHEKSTLRPTIEAFLGRPLSAEELRGFDLESLVGRNCHIQVAHVPGNDGNPFAIIKAIVPFGNGIDPIEPES